MLSNGYFLYSNAKGNSGGSDISIEDGSIVYNPADPIYVDSKDRVFYSEEKKNAYLDMSGNKVMAKKVS